MEKIGVILPLFELNTRKSTLNKRSLIIQEFEIQINNEREAQGWGYFVGKKWIKVAPITGKELALRLAHIKDTDDLLVFLSNCKDYKKRKGSFQKCFYGSLKFDKEKAI